MTDLLTRTLGDAVFWVCAGVAGDRFIQFTEGVIAEEQLEPRATFTDGVTVVAHERHLVAEVAPREGAARVGVSWRARPAERFTGLGARHLPAFDQTGRAAMLGADRRYTGPDCPPELLEAGGIPQGDYVPVPWFVSSAGYA
ncbi:MAG TPA: hypothetical protein VE570_12880, partial [Thermoleophilaceae bacterium]|nr:hypothetical protein [Thermoleophilaceae bacterium]